VSYDNGISKGAPLTVVGPPLSSPLVRSSLLVLLLTHRRHRPVSAVLPKTGSAWTFQRPVSPVTRSYYLLYSYSRSWQITKRTAFVLASSSRLSYNSHPSPSFFKSPQPLPPSPLAKAEIMMGFLTSAVAASKRPRGASVGEEIPEDTEPDDTSILCVSSSPYPPFDLFLPPPLPPCFPLSLLRLCSWWTLRLRYPVRRFQG
jgi:hypothetical protein